MTTLKDLLRDFQVQTTAIANPPEGVEYPLMDKKQLLEDLLDEYIQIIIVRLIGGEK